MQVLLRIANGKSNVRKVRIQADTVIGRSPECQLKVASNQISRRHCLIVVRDTLVAIKDLGSANGTFVNGRQLPPEVEVPLTPGTRVMLGPLQFTVEYELPGLVSTTRTTSEQANETAADDSVDLFDNGAVDEQDAVLAPPQQQPVFGIPSPAGAVVDAVNAEENGIPEGSWLNPAPAAAAEDLGQTAFMMNPLLAMPVEDLRAPPPVQPDIFQNPAPFAPVAPVVPTAAVVPTANVVPTPAPMMPGIVPAQESPSQDDPSFNFGIIAASGSGVVVESAAEMPIFDPTEIAAPPPTPVVAKPAKKGFLQMLGWGKKKAATPPAETAPETPATQDPVADAPIASEVLVDFSAESRVIDPAAVETVAESASPFGMPMPPPGAAETGSDSTPDESLQNFFNNFK